MTSSPYPSPEELLEGLDPQQREVALQVSGPLAVRAGAGTGKTRAITYRIAYGAATGAVDPSTVLAVTFTSKAATEMAVRLGALGASRATAATFHSAALRQLRYFWPHVFGGEIPAIVPNKAALVAAAGGRLGIDMDRALVRDLAAEVEWSKVSLVDAATYPEYATRIGRTPPGDLEVGQFAAFFEAYEKAKEERGGIDFEDILLILSAVLESREDVAMQVRSRYRSFVVDEYQDVSPVQQHLLDLWRGGRSDLCVVGDVAQTIYSFTGASARYLEDFAKRMPGARELELVRDYRSTPQVVAVANQVVARSRGLDGLAPKEGLPGAVKLIAQRPTGPAVAFVKYATDEEEADGVAQQIRKLIQGGTKASAIAILYRINSQSEALEAALQKAGVPFQLHGGARFFDREEVRRAVILLRQTARQGMAIGEGAADAGATALPDLVQAVVATLGWRSEAPSQGGAAAERWSNLDALVNLAKRSPHLNLDQFVQELQARAETQAAPEVEGVVLSTLHGSKGLEWGAVFLVGLSEGLLPISLAVTPAEIEEERRLLYVGITRAEEHLQLSWAGARMAGRSQSRRLSRFLVPLWPEPPARGRPRREGGGHSGGGRAGGGQTGTSAGRKRAAAEFDREADSDTRALFEDLRQWRVQEARDADRPAFTVLPDTTLRDIAWAKPTTLQQLGLLRGIGHVKLKDYGTQILRVVRPYRER